MVSDAEQLLRFGSPSAVGRLTAGDWLPLERELGPLPADFKAIVSVFGYGSFGDLVFLHPKHPVARLRLPEGFRLNRTFLQQLGSEAVDQVLQEFPLLLGAAGTRRYLLHGGQGWALLDFEDEGVLEIGSDLIAVLAEAYVSLSQPSPWTPIATTVWKTGPDGSTAPFFSAAS